MLKLIIGFILGYWVAYNKETVKEYFNICVNWIKEKCKAIKEKNNKKDNSETV